MWWSKKPSSVSFFAALNECIREETKETKNCFIWTHSTMKWGTITIYAMNRKKGRKQQKMPKRNMAKRCWSVGKRDFLRLKYIKQIKKYFCTSVSLWYKFYLLKIKLNVLQILYLKVDLLWRSFILMNISPEINSWPSNKPEAYFA